MSKGSASARLGRLAAKAKSGTLLGFGGLKIKNFDATNTSHGDSGKKSKKQLSPAQQTQLLKLAEKKRLGKRMSSTEKDMFKLLTKKARATDSEANDD